LVHRFHSFDVHAFTSELQVYYKKNKHKGKGVEQTQKLVMEGTLWGMRLRHNELCGKKEEDLVYWYSTTLVTDWYTYT